MVVHSDEATWRDRGWFDPSAANADQRRELLRWLLDRGITGAQIDHAVATNQLNALAGDIALRPGEPLTLQQMADRVGLPAGLAERMRQAAGLPAAGPDETVYRDADRPLFEVFAAAAQVFSEDELLHLTRVVGLSLRRIAEACGEMFLRDVEAPMLGESSVTELDRAQLNLQAIELARGASAVFEPLFLGHMEVATQAMRRARAGDQSYDTVDLTVGFIDISGFTASAERLEPAELLRTVVEFEQTAHDLITRHGGRLIKLIGDEAMFTTIEADAACQLAREFVDHFAASGRDCRGGLSRGPVVTSGGDIYGTPVNVASRVADIAIPGEILCTEAVATGARTHRFEPGGRRQLKGISEPVPLWSLER